MDRADAARANPSRLEDLARDPNAKELAWKDGLPAIGADGTLQ